jgi:hypothetical protein
MGKGKGKVRRPVAEGKRKVRKGKERKGMGKRKR